jgi:hypothetical protein
MQQTIGERWHEEAEKHLLRDGVVITIVIFLAWIVFTMFGYTCMAMADASPVERVDQAVFEVVSDLDHVGVDVSVIQNGAEIVVEAETARQEAEQLAEYELDYDYLVSEEYSDDGSGGYDDWASNFRYSGGGSDGTYSYTWYSQDVLSGGGLTELNNNGRHVDDRDFVCDGDGYIAVAMDGVEKGTVVSTPWGEGKVYDSVSDSDEYTGHIDVYTNY